MSRQGVAKSERWTSHTWRIQGLHLDSALTALDSSSSLLSTAAARRLCWTLSISSR